MQKNLLAHKNNSMTSSIVTLHTPVSPAFRLKPTFIYFLSWFVFVTRSGIISSSWVKLTSASVEITLADQYQAWSNCERLIEHSQTESSYSIHSQAEHVTTMCLAEGIKRPDEWTFQGSSLQTFLGSKGVWQCFKCSSVWPTSKKDFCVIPKSCTRWTLQ